MRAASDLREKDEVEAKFNSYTKILYKRALSDQIHVLLLDQIIAS